MQSEQPQRQVVFDDLDAFIEEMSLDAELVENKVVRCEVSAMEINPALKQVFLKAGYFIGNEWRQLELHLGSSPPDRGEQDGAEMALNAWDKVAACCESYGLQCRRGVYR